MYRPPSDKAIGATKAASIAAEEEVDVTASWRDVPKIAYTNIPSMAGIQAHLGRNTSDACVCHSLRDEQPGERDAGYHVSANRFR
jgi:hypothetical protein